MDLKKNKKLVIILELMWWLFTAVVLVGVLLPIWREVPEYPFWLSNILFIVVFITFSRWIFLTKYTFFAGRQLLKVGIISISVPVIFLLISELNFFQTYLGEEGLDKVLKDLHFSRQEQMFTYIRNEMLFFGTAGVISAILLPFKMAISIWKKHNKGVD